MSNITQYYNAVNELACLLADGLINSADWYIQRKMVYQAYHGGA